MSHRQSLRIIATVMGLAVALAALPAQAQDTTKTKLDVALELAAQTGRPVFVVGSRQSCGLCQAFLAELNGDRNARAVMSQFVPVKLDIDSSAEWQALTKYPYESGGSLPILMVFRADGEQIYGRSGAPEQTALFLVEQLKKSGTQLSSQQLAQLRESIDKAQALIDEGKIEQAVPLLKKYAGSGSYAAAAIQLDKMVEELTATGKAALEAAEQEMKSGSPSFEAALKFLDVERQYGGLPGLAITIREKGKTYRKDDAWAALMDQATLFDKAQRYASEGNSRQAAGYFQGLKQKYPGTPAAERADQELAKLDAAPPAASVSSASSAAAAPKAEDSEANLKQAASYLRFGKTFHFSNPDNARKYYEKVIEVAPNSDLAAEARKRIADLP